MAQRVRSRKGAPGIIEVASRAGVSPATVSRVYNSPELVKAPTRKRVEKAALDLGYIRNRLAGSLHNRFTGAVGLIVPTIDNAIFAEMIEAFAGRLQDHDRTMLIAAHGYDLSLETAIVRSLLERRIDGVVLVGFDHDAVPLNMLAQRDVPAISIWNYSDNAPLPCIGADNHKAGATVTEHLIALGHRDIAFLFPETESNDRARGRMQGALEAAASAGLKVPSRRVVSCAYDIGESKETARKLLSKNAPTAVVCGNDIIAHGVLYACHANGLRVPEEISVVGIGDFRGSAHMEPGLTTVRIPARQIGRLAADAIVDMSETRRPPDPARRAIEVSFMERGSTGPSPRA